QRDHVMKRQFDNTIRGDLRDSLAHRDEGERAFVYDRIEELAKRYLTDNLFRRMQVVHRAIIAAALRRDTDTVLALLQLDAEKGHGVGLHVVDGRAHFTYPAFDPADPAVAAAYEITHERPVTRIGALLSPAEVTFDGSTIEVRGTARIEGSPVL